MATVSERIAGRRAGLSPALTGVLLIGLGAFCFSLAPIFARKVVGYQAPAIAFYRALSAMLLMAVLTVRSAERRADIDLRRLSRRTLLAVLALGVVMGLTSILYTYSYLHTTVAKSVLLDYTAPIYIAFLGPWLLHEARSRWSWPAVALGFAGMVCIVDPAKLGTFSAGELSGIVAGAFSGVTFAAVFMLGRYLADKIQPIARTFIGGVVMTVMFLPWGLSVPGNLFWQNIPWLLALGFIGMGLPYLFIFAGQRYVTAQVGSMVALFEPVCLVIIGYILYGEQLSPLGIIGAVAVLVSIYLASK